MEIRRIRNREGNPNIVEEGRKWRKRTFNWRIILAQISKTRSTGPKSDHGKFRSSLNSIKYELGSKDSRIRIDSLMGQLLMAHMERLEKKNP